jgi:exodeoxyribonuclease VII large subunit
MSVSPLAEGIAGSELAGPYPVGAYAAALKRRLLAFSRVQVVGEVWGVRSGRARVYFELRDGQGALPCSMWSSDYDTLGLELVDGLRVIAAGGCDYYPGSASASPSFTFAVTELRIEGEGDLLIQLERLRRRLHADGLFEPQKRLPRVPLPRTIGVVTGEQGKARDDVLAGLRRRGWAGRLVWAFVPVQDRRAAPLIATALRDLAALREVDIVIVARGGGSLADLFAFCDEALCRTVALLRVPVISSVGHHTDRTLIDEVAAVACSTPTHAAEAAVPIDCAAARTELAGVAERLQVHARRAVLVRARELAQLSAAPSRHLERHRRHLHQLVRELRACGRRVCAAGESTAERQATALARRAAASAREVTQSRDAEARRAALLEQAATVSLARRRKDLGRLALALSAHDPQRTLERGYAIVSGRDGEPVLGAAAARQAHRVTLRFHDGAVPASVLPEGCGDCDSAPAGRARALEAPMHSAGPAGNGP